MSNAISTSLQTNRSNRGRCSVSIPGPLLERLRSSSALRDAVTEGTTVTVGGKNKATASPKTPKQWHTPLKATFERAFGAFTLLLLICLGCDSTSEDRPSSSLARYSPLPPLPFRATSRISDDIQTMTDDGPVVKNRTRLTEVLDSGIDFTYENGARGQALMVEATGGGCGWLDYDSDGQPDLYLGQGGNPAAPASAEQPNDRLFRNLGNGRFEDVTSWTLIDERGYGQGVAVADFDNDGFDDIFVTNVGFNALFQNRGDGTFHPVDLITEAVPPAWSTGAAWGDLDRDGDLDLYVCHYCIYDPMHPKPCFRTSGEPGTCHPKDVEPAPDECYLNQGDGTFRSVATERGLYGPGNRALGIAIADFDNDDWPDIYVANDTTKNFLFVNQRNAYFEERGEFLGCAVNVNGSPQASMGVAVGDYDRNGYLDLYVTHFHNEWNTLYQNLGPNGFHDVTAQAMLAVPTMEKLGFGTVMIDFDQNGYPELLVANGHIDDVTSKGIEFEMAPQLFAYNGRVWDDVTAAGGDFFQRKMIGRGVATCDFDGDGDLDVAVVLQNSKMALLRNDSQRGHWLKLRFQGINSNRHGIGTRVTLRSGKTTWMQELAGGTSYCSSHEPVLIFGLGDAADACSLEVRWPNGLVQSIANVTVDQDLVLREPSESAPK